MHIPPRHRHRKPRWLRRAAFAAVCAASLCAQASTLTRADRLSPLAAGYLERAKIMLADGNYAGVIDQLKHLDTQDSKLQPGERETCAYLLALALYERGDADCVDMLRDFAESWPASPQALPARLAAADYFFFAHRYGSALAAYSDIDAARINPADRSLYTYRRALSMIKTGHYAEAQAPLQQLLGDRSYNLAARYYLAYLDYAAGDLPAAAQGFADVARDLGSTHAADGMAPEYYLAQIEYARGEYKEAAAHGAALLQTDTEPELAADTKRITGLSLFKLGDYTQARRMLTDYLRHEEVTPASDAVYALGVMDYNDGDLFSAQTRFASLTGLDNDLAQSAYLYLGQIAVREHDSNAAAISFEKASRMNHDPGVTETALYNYVAARTHGGNIPFGSSVGLLTGFLERYPRSLYAPAVEEYLATAYFNEKDYAKALESINRIPSPSRQVLEAKQKTLLHLGMEAMSTGRPSEARTLLTEAVGLAGTPDIKAQARLWLGDALYALADYSGAETQYRAYLAADRRGPNRTTARYDLAYSLLMQDKYSQAVAAFAEALNSDPALPQRMREDALLRLADSEYYAGNHRAARTHYAQAVANGSQDSDYAAYRHAVMQGLDGDTNAKLQELNDILRRYPDSRWLPDILLEKGETLAATGDTQQAVRTFEQLRHSHAKSAQARKGMLSLAIAYAGAGEGDRAQDAYREVIAKWPTSQEAQLAHADLTRLLAGTGGLREYAEWLRGIAGAPQMDNDSMESAAFEGAETRLDDDPTDTALLEAYVRDWPQGRNLAQALLDLATAYAEGGRADDAITAADRLLADRPDSPQVPEALLIKAGALEAKGPSSHRAAAETYRTLRQLTGAEYEADCLTGLMRTADKGADRVRYAKEVLGAAGVSAADMDLARLTVAEAALEGGTGTAAAVGTLRALAANPASPAGARGAVVLGEYLLANGDVNGADKVLTDFTDAGTPHAYWLARGFIALADVAHMRGKDYLAHEYLKSLQDNYPGTEPDIHDMIAERLKRYKR